MFFPQLVAGPSERPQNLLHQFKEKKAFDRSRASEGLSLILWGLFKKVVIADRLGIVVNSVYGDLTHSSGPTMTIATLFFAIQIYCDFSGYSDMARGSAHILGFDLMKNFNEPYLSKSISEFWTRWHISLSTWFKDYVYVPLGGNRVSGLKWTRNILITFLLSGLWHGANWTFMCWGLLNGVLLVIERIFGRGFGRVATFILICTTWVFFRAASLKDAVYIFSNFYKSWGEFAQNFMALGPRATGLVYGRAELLFCILLCLGICLAPRIMRFREHLHFPVLQNRLANNVLHFALYLLILLYGRTESTEFIYFAF